MGVDWGSALGAIFFSLYQYHGGGEDMRFVLQLQIIEVINVDNKVQTEKKIRKH